MATELDRLRLLLFGNIGIAIRCSSGKIFNTLVGSPVSSGPNKKESSQLYVGLV
jgi:hypothetical protein|tara:strand:- start:126 stop:287 length:162 start_codon:yes stop_codon:yes gene_type:complete